MEPAGRTLRVALYARVSTNEQSCENQLLEIRHFCVVRGWGAGHEYRDEGISGVSTRPALQKLMADARRRRFDVLVVWRLDRLGRNLRDLLMHIEELSTLGIGFVSLGEGLDLTTPAGRLQCHLLAALAEFERERIRERVLAGLARARKHGTRLGRPRLQPLPDHAPRDSLRPPGSHAVACLEVDRRSEIESRGATRHGKNLLPKLTGFAQCLAGFHDPLVAREIHPLFPRAGLKLAVLNRLPLTSSS